MYYVIEIFKTCLCLPETALKLDSLIGDIEDAVSSTMNKTMRKHASTKKSEVSTCYLKLNAVVSLICLNGSL